jgi:hypothetical protein
MANTIKIKRRPSSGSAGKPSSLFNGELAFNENDNILYYGYGSGVGGAASSIEQIGGSGYFAHRGGINASGLWPVSVTGNAGTVTNGVYTTGTQTIGGQKTFSSSPVVSGNLAGQLIFQSANSVNGGHIIFDGVNLGSESSYIKSSTSAMDITHGTKIQLNSALEVIAANTSSNNVGYFAVFDSNPASSLTTLKSVSKSDVLDDIGGASSGISMTAGSGLVGGGNLTQSRTFDIGQGDGITVSADSIAVNNTVVRTTGTQDIVGAKSFYESSNTVPIFSTASDVISVKAPNTSDQTYYFLGLNGGGSPPSSTTAERSLVSRSTSQVKTDLSLNNVTNDAQIKKLASTSGGYIPTWNGTTGDALNIGYSVETTLSGSSAAIPRADAVKTYVDALLSANDAMIFKGTLGTGGTITSLPTTYSAGWTYRVITAGTYAGVVCEVGDLIIAVIDRSGTGNLNSDWTVAQTNIDGAVLTTRTLTAGNGLTGGGDLSTDRTFNVGAGDGISVASDSVAVDSTVVRTTGVQDITGAKNFSGNIISSGTLSLKMATTASTATQFPVFVADPSASAQNVLTRTPSQVKTDIGLSNVENTALSTWAGSTNLTTLGTVATGVWSATTIAVNKGGTGQTSYTDGQLLIGNSTGNTLSKATLTAGTSVDITNGNGSITIGHADTSTLTGAQGGNGIAAFTLDGLGHVTAVTTATYLTAGTVCAAIVDCTLDGGSF